MHKARVCISPFTNAIGNGYLPYPWGGGRGGLGIGRRRLGRGRGDNGEECPNVVLYSRVDSYEPSFPFFVLGEGAGVFTILSLPR